MIKSLIGLALVATAATGLAAPVQAHALRTDSTKDSLLNLVGKAESLGIRFNVDSETCQENENLMGYMEAPTMVMTFCAENHRARGGDFFFEMADTLRHELIHAAQFCKASYSQAAILFPQHIEHSRDFAQEHLGWNILGYPAHQWDAEGEARTVSHEASDAKVAGILDAACRYKDSGRSMVGDIRLGRRPLFGLARPEKRR